MSDHPADALDTALLALSRAGTKPPLGVYAWAIGYRASIDAGLDTTDPIRLAEITGYKSASMRRARRWLDVKLPGWTPDVPLEMLLPQPVPAEHTPAPAWRRAINEQLLRVQGRRSWDLYADAYSPAVDQMFQWGEIGDVIALTIDFLEAATGDELTEAERRRIAQLVRTSGKAALYGLSEAIHRVDTQTIPQYVIYATAVCKNTNHRLNRRDAERRRSTNGDRP